MSRSLIPSAVQRIAVLGAGHVGPVIARLALDAGFEVAIAASGSPEDLELITRFVMPGVEARWAADAVAARSELSQSRSSRPTTTGRHQRIGPPQVEYAQEILLPRRITA